MLPDGLISQGGPPVEERLDERLRQYWLMRVAKHMHDTYAGITLNKFPEDLRVYEHLLWEGRVDSVVEIGVHNGASQLWFRDRLRTMRTYGRIEHLRVVGVDIGLELARANLAQADPGWAEDIELVEGSIEDPAVTSAVRSLVPENARCLVVEDSAHVYSTTTASLHGLASLVRPGGYFVVEDGCVDIDAMRLEADWPRGVLPAIEDWLGTPEGSAFRRRRDVELYGLTCHPGGFLQRVTD